MTDPAATSVTAATAPAGPVQIFVNGEPRRAEGASLADWLAGEGLAAEAVATAVNGDFVPRGARVTVMLRDGDRLDVFRAIVGG